MKAILLRFKIEFFMLAVATLVFVGLIIASLLRTPGEPLPPPQPQPEQLVPKGIISEESFSTFKEVEIGKTTEQELQTLSNLTEKTTQNPDTREFVYNSAFDYRENAIITEDSVAAFKRIIPVNPNDWSSPQISYYQNIYGTPQAEHVGSATYGRFMKTYIYADKGAAVIFNPSTGEVFEIQLFSPVTVDQYLEKWGSDIKDYSQEPIEGP